MNERMIFLRTAWMNRYRGLNGDHIHGGDAFVQQNGFGYEIFNFQPFKGRNYGYVPMTETAPRIDINNLGATKADDYIPNVLVVWVATSPKRSEGKYVVGWYRNAIVCREYQDPPEGAGRHHAGHDCGYFITADEHEVVLLPPDKRVFQVLGGGRSSIWYADGNNHEDFKDNVLKYINKGTLQRRTSGRGGKPRRSDPERRSNIERKAVECTTALYEDFGYWVDSVERDNVGWDLNAVLGSRELKLEVKGLSGSEIRFELTPNEYKNMKHNHHTYRVCVVTDALATPQLTVFTFNPETWKLESQFTFNPETRKLESQDGSICLEITEFTGARCSV